MPPDSHASHRYNPARPICPIAVSSSPPSPSTAPTPDGAAIAGWGDVGIPPMLCLAAKLAAQRAVAFCGPVRRDLLPLTLLSEPDVFGEPGLYIAEFPRRGIPAVVTTDDGSA